MGFVDYQIKKITGSLIKVDPLKIIKSDIENYKKLGVNFNEGTEVLKEIFGIDFLNSTLSFKKGELSTKSYQFILFASLSKKYNIKKILEIGTYDGENSYVLSKIFNNAKIDTVDLPEKDITEGSFGNTINAIGLKKHINNRNKNLSAKNINFIESNSFFLPSLDNQKFKKDYDLVFVDGNHLFPEVSWDTFFGYHHLKKNGSSFLVMDDFLDLGKYETYNSGRFENNEKVSIVDVYKMCEKLKIITGKDYVKILKTHPDKDKKYLYLYPKKLKSLAIFKF
tara:strand:- start:383 stop:1225 length:843 start_codon:yes stop_codon:yes gene_type:complete